MDLVILAAGLGSRFGGDKQIEHIDKDGNFILDYSVYDAVRAGFNRVILIIRKEHKEIFEKTIGKRLKKIVKVEYAFQDINDVPKGTKIPKERTKPWGTAHALYCCKDILSDRFAVINADDFYGFESFKILADFLKRNKDNQFLCVGFMVKNTLSEKGAVKRGILSIKNNMAQGLVESLVEKRGEKLFATPLRENSWHEIPSDTMASMTMFGFSKKILEQIEKEIKEFFKQDEEKLKSGELLLPESVGNMLGKSATMEVIPTPAKWYGMTYREDVEIIKNSIQDMKNEGKYPQKLWK